ncbi:MAG TPA: hypothetical protein VG389_26750 [Myxococcota bacterium]|nr:hypothetical protein [Myxococcota bacterium]
MQLVHELGLAHLPGGERTGVVVDDQRGRCRGGGRLGGGGGSGAGGGGLGGGFNGGGAGGGGGRALQRRARQGARALLHHVRELVGEQALAWRGLGRVLPPCEDDVTAGRESQRADCAGRRVCSTIGVNPHRAEVEAEARLEKAPHGRRERLAAREIGDLRGNPRRHGRDASRRLLRAHGAGQPLVVLGALAAAATASTACAGTLDVDRRRVANGGSDRSRLTCTHHRVGDAVGFPLVRVVGASDGQARLPSYGGALAPGGARATVAGRVPPRQEANRP